MAERGLADARRPHRAEDRAGEIVLELEHRQVLEDPLLDLVEVEVVLVEDLVSFEVEVVLRVQSLGLSRIRSRWCG